MPKAHTPKRLRLFATLFLLLCIACGLAWKTILSPASSHPSHPTQAASASSAAASLPADASSSPEKNPSAPSLPLEAKSPASPAQTPPDPALLDRFKQFHANLRAGMSRDDTLAALQDLKKQVHDLPPEVAAATLVALLRSGEDAPTGLGFVVGDEGVLAESPRYRVALLDLLGQTDPDTAVAYSRSILAETTQPDEYALALRNLAWLDHEGTLTAEVSSRFSAMLDRTDWLAAPTTGYLEAFDIAVAVGGNTMISELSSVLRLTTHDPAVDRAKIDRAAFIALDRIMQREPDSIAALFTADPTFLDFAPNHRASLLSRLDPASPSGQKTLRTYLQSIPPAGEELAYFIKIFPNPNSFEGNRLVTSWETSSTPTTSITRRDQAALAFVETLLTESTYVDLAPPLQTLRTRLLTYTRPPDPAP